MAVEVVLPALGLTVEKGTILNWIKKEGDEVNKGDSLYEVETDKATTEVESPASGILKKIIVPEGVEIPILTVVAVITDAAESLEGKYLKAAVPEPEGKKNLAVSRQVQQASAPVSAGALKAAPAARLLAKERGFDLSLIKGSGPEGTILLKDVERFSAQGSQSGPEASLMPQPPSGSKYKLGQIIPMTSMRKTIARRMAQSKSSVPHIYFFHDVDMERLLDLREEIVGDFEKNEGTRVSVNDFMIKAVALTLREFPILNSKVSGEEIHIFPEINIGLAVAMEDGLIVPAVPKADQLSLGEIARHRTDLVERARRSRLTLEEMERGTFTISSLARFEITSFAAALNPPQSGILTLGKVEERPVARNGQLLIRRMMTQGLSADHRIIDGIVAARFLQSLRNKLESPLPLVS
jgi:pyruvate dehydrogenase E2 component (dihydrolipoamide acetyltransferase)